MAANKHCLRVTLPGSKIVWRVVPSRAFVEGEYRRADGTLCFRRPTDAQRRAAMMAAAALA